jgi:hypothetical protein
MGNTFVADAGRERENLGGRPSELTPARWLVSLVGDQWVRRAVRAETRIGARAGIGDACICPARKHAGSPSGPSDIG